MDKVLLSKRVGRCEESLCWQITGNHAQTQWE